MSCRTIRDYPPLPTAEEKIEIIHTVINPWSNNTTSQKIKRVAMFIKNDKEPEFTCKIVASICGGVATGAAVGASAGAVTGFIVGNLPGCAFGAAIGAGVGAGVGMIAGTSATGLLIRNTYINWKRFCRYEAVLPVLIQLQQNYKVFENCLCPISYEVFQDPIRIPTGVTYERGLILDFLKKKNGSTLDPLQTMIINEHDLYDDHAMRGFILMALEFLLKSDLEILEFNEDDHVSLQSLIKDIGLQIVKAEKLGREQNIALFAKKIIKAREYVLYNQKLDILVRD